MTPTWRTKAIVIGLVIIALVGAPVVTTRVFASDGGGAKALAFKEYVLDLAARALAKIIYTQLIGRISKTLATLGPTGGPIWIENWRNFFRDSQDRGRDIFTWQLYDAALGDRATICNYLADPIAELFDARPNAEFGGRTNEIFRFDAPQPFNIRNRCTLPDNFDLEEYLNNDQFDREVFLKLLEPQNNALGLLFNSLEEQSRQVAAEQYTSETEGISGSGFRSVRDAAGRIVSPGKLLSDVQSATITKEIDWIISADELEEVLMNATKVVIDRLINYAVAAIAPDPFGYQDVHQEIDRSTCTDLCAATARAKCDVDSPTITICTNVPPSGGDPGGQRCEEKIVPNVLCRTVTEQQCRQKFGCE